MCTHACLHFPALQPPPPPPPPPRSFIAATAATLTPVTLN